MEILIIFSSESGNTKKVTEMLQTVLQAKNYTVKVKHALTAKQNHIEEADIVLIGTPVHGYILFGQKPEETIRELIKTGLPQDLQQKLVIGFATYLFFPAGTLKKVKKAVTKHNGNYLASFAKRRSNKQALVSEILEFIVKTYPVN